MARSSLLMCLFLTTAVLATAAQEPNDLGPALDVFEPPVRLMADDQVIDTGTAWGHSSPSIVDLDGDSIRDLLLGDFSGKFRIYRNVGSNQSPRYEKGNLLQAGGVDAEVWIYCCIGCQPRFCDLDGDGLTDMISNSYDPGHCYLFRGQPGNTFAAREELLDKAGVPIRSAPVQQQSHQSFGSFFEVVDWDDDGDLDILIGCFDGGMQLRINEGTATHPEFATENIVVNAAGAPMKVKAHLCPRVADWDVDGLWDIVAGSDDGSVTWFRNSGTVGAPQFDAGQTLVAAASGNGYNVVLWSEQDAVPGIRSQVEVVDYNCDGKLDLLLGDFYTSYQFRSDLTEDQKKEAERLVNEGKSIGKAFAAKMEALQADFNKRYPGDAVFSDEATKEWSAAYQALRESPEAKTMETKENEFVAKFRPLLAETQGTSDRSFDLAKSHGHVWLFIRR